MPIQLRFTLSFEDYLAAQSLHARRSWWPRLNLALAYTLVPLIGVFFILISIMIARNGDSWGFFAAELAAGLFLVCYPLYLRLRWKRCYVRTRSEPAESTVEIDNSMIRIEAANMRSEVEWHGVRSCSENQKVFLLYLAPARFVVIPKRVCSAQQVEELRSLFKQEIGAVHQ